MAPRKRAPAKDPAPPEPGATLSEVFADEDSSRRPTEAQNLKLPADLRDELHDVAAETGISISKIAADGIRLQLDRLEKAMARMVRRRGAAAATRSDVG